MNLKEALLFPQCMFAHSLRKFSMRDWGIEQKWMSILLPLLLLYNGESETQHSIYKLVLLEYVIISIIIIIIIGAYFFNVFCY